MQLYIKEELFFSFCKSRSAHVQRCMVLRVRRSEEKIKVESVLEHGHKRETEERKEMGKEATQAR